MSRARKICSVPRCPNTQPCPAHPKVAWAGSRRRERVGKSGSRQQKLARFVLQRDQGICHWCGKPGADEADHVIPLAEGGLHHVSNMKAIHKVPCHTEKTSQESARARARERV